ncbi:zinc-binding alcohol dehydrogenase family protein [Yokenella regensburgei]|uniref:zinc-binding alcohol dehydrogenase family protein n=1 Tax=Yokenella regensburgei TaxID=158877 RepID=UPI003F169F58
MKAIAITRAAQSASNIDFLTDIELPTPRATGHDLLVEVKAISVNPVDTKVRAGFNADTPRVLGWDAVGVVVATGNDVTLFKPGDEVWYAGALTRPGSNSEFQLVDERIVALKPNTLDNASAAALPLTAITAWELLFDRLGVQEDGNEGDILLIVGAAGGVGSILTQLARQLTKLTVIGTASRPESQQWVSARGAHYVIDHTRPLAEELARIGVKEVSHVASLTNTDDHYQQLIDALQPQGKLALIDDPETLDARPLKVKSISLHWEFMFTRSMFETTDMIEQHRLLTRVAVLIDNGALKTTLGEHFGEINAHNLRRAHQRIETQRAVGKIVLEGFASR